MDFLIFILLLEIAFKLKAVSELTYTFIIIGVVAIVVFVICRSLFHWPIFSPF